MIQKSDVVSIGHFYKPHGICGELNFAFTNDVFDRTDSPYWIVELDGILVPFFVESYRFRSATTALVKMEDIDDEKAARLLSDREVYYPKRYLDDTDEESDFLTWSQLVGYHLFHSFDEQCIGTIEAVDESTLNVLFYIRNDQQTFMVPAVEDWIEKIEPEHARLYMNFPKDLLHLDDYDTD